jgi:hypothetical protein
MKHCKRIAIFCLSSVVLQLLEVFLDHCMARTLAGYTLQADIENIQIHDRDESAQKMFDKI